MGKFSADQQELLDLLSNELAEMVDFDYSPLDAAEADQVDDDHEVRQALFNDCAAHTDNLGNAARLVGLEGFALCCKFLAYQCEVLENQTLLSKELVDLFRTWTQPFLEYLQNLSDEESAVLSAEKILSVIQHPAWPEPLSSSALDEIKDAFAVSAVDLNDDAEKWPSDITDEMLSLECGDDVRPELLDGLLTELPGQTNTFTSAIDRYIESRNEDSLIAAQRMAHTIKGAANVVGIRGIANLTHFLEDFLEQFSKQKNIDLTPELSDLLLDASDCLANSTDYLLGFGPPPDNLKPIIEAILGELKALSGESEADVGDEECNIKSSEPEDDIASDDIFDVDALDSDIESLVDSLTSEQSDIDVDSLEQVVAEQLNVDEDFYENASPGFHLEDILPPEPIITPETAIELGLGQSGSPEPIELKLREQQSSELEPSNQIIEEPLLEPSISVSAPGLDRPRIDSEFKNASQPRGEEEKTQKEAKTQKDNTQETVKRDDAQSRSSLSITDETAHELMRLAGESQIVNTQIMSRLELMGSGVNAANQYHKQIRQMAMTLEKLLEQQSANMAAHADADDNELDPLELERYNELNSFASQLQELTTDAHEAIAHLDDNIKELSGIAIEQRNMGLEAQAMVMKIRMLPASVLSSRFMRCVRQASRLTNKSVSLSIEGEYVHIDSRVLNAIVDPIMHLLRNAVDHGIEDSSALREAAGKTKNGNIVLSFSEEGESVVIQCRDDGRGLDYTRIEVLAKERGLINTDLIPTHAELSHIILTPGFSTREKASHTSGRGIGLDVVHEQVRQLKGMLSIDSSRGTGTTITLRVPMSVLSAHTLMAHVGDAVVSIVSRTIHHVIYIQPDDIEMRSDHSGDKAFYRDQDGSLIPLMTLSSLLHSTQEEDAFDKAYAAIALVKRPDGATQGVLIETISGAEVQVIKPLNAYTYKPEGVIGATILGNGSVSSVIDLQDLPGIRLSEPEYTAWKAGRGEEYKAQFQQLAAERPMALIVDDSLSARRSLAQFVSDMGMEVKTARDGYEAINVMDEKRPAIMLVDLEMPRMNGLELTAHVRRHAQTENIPIIMITSRSTDKHKNLARNAGVSGYLSKPWTDDDLMKSIQQQLTG